MCITIILGDKCVLERYKIHTILTIMGSVWQNIALHYERSASQPGWMFCASLMKRSMFSSYEILFNGLGMVTINWKLP